MSNSAVSKYYFGTDQVYRSMTMLASLSVLLSKYVIDTIGIMKNAEHPDLCN